MEQVHSDSGVCNEIILVSNLTIKDHVPRSELNIFEFHFQIGKSNVKSEWSLK